MVEYLVSKPVETGHNKSCNIYKYFNFLKNLKLFEIPNIFLFLKCLTTSCNHLVTGLNQSCFTKQPVNSNSSIKHYIYFYLFTHFT